MCNLSPKTVFRRCLFFSISIGLARPRASLVKCGKGTFGNQDPNYLATTGLSRSHFGHGSLMLTLEQLYDVNDLQLTHKSLTKLRSLSLKEV